MFEITTAATASHKSPGPAKASSAVATAAQRADRQHALLGRAQVGQCPSEGIVSMTTALDSASALVQASVAHEALPATTPTK